MTGLLIGLEQYHLNHVSSAPITTHQAGVEAIKQTDLESH